MNRAELRQIGELNRVIIDCRLVCLQCFLDLIGQREPEIFHDVDVLIAGLASESRIRGFLLADGGGMIAAIIVSRVNDRIVRQREHRAVDTVILRAGITAREVRTSSSADQQRVSTEQLSIRVDAEPIRCMSRRRQHLELIIAQFKHVSITDMNCDVRRGSMSFHHDLGVGEIGQIENAAAMIGVSVGVDQILEAEAVVRSDRNIAAGVLLERVDKSGLARAFASQHVGFALASIQFTTEHDTPPLGGAADGAGCHLTPVLDSLLNTYITK